MNELLPDLVPLLFRATVVMVIGGFVVGWSLRRLRPQAVWIHRVAWTCVLANGLILAPIPIPVPILEPVRNSLNEHQLITTNSTTLRLPVADVVPKNAAISFAELSIAEPETKQTQSDSVWTIVRQSAALVWFFGCLAAFGVGCALWLILQRILRNTHRAATVFQREVDDVVQSMRCPGRVPLLFHQSLGPMLCLTWRGYRIVVPQDVWPRLTHDERIAVLSHELAHRKRGDVWKSLAARLLALPHWFNPMAWQAVRRFEEAAEWASDDELARRHPERIADFAAAMLRFAERKHIQTIGVSAAQGAPLCTRLKRLLDDGTQREDSLMKRTIMFAVLGMVGLVGAFQFNLVAREADEETEENINQVERDDDDQEWEHRAAALAKKLNVGDDALMKQFQTALATEPGRIVLHDRADHFEAEARERAESQAVPDWYASHFTENNGRLTPKSEQAKFQKELLEVTKSVNADLEVVKNVFQETAKRVKTETEIERLFVRFLNSEAAPMVIYIHELQRRLRPDLGLLLEATDGLFVRRGDGRIEIHPGRRDDAQEHLKKVHRINKALPLIREELADWSRDIASTDDFQKSAKKTLGDPKFAAYIALQVLEDEEGRDTPVAQRLDGFFEMLEEFTEDTADGLVFRKEAREEIKQPLAEFSRMTKSMDALQGPFDELAKRLSEDDELNRGWREILKSDLIRLRVAAEIGPVGSDAETAVKGLLGEFLHETEDDKLELALEEPEEVQEFVQNGFHDFRTLRRRGRFFDTFSRRIENKEIATALQSTGGRLYVIREVEKRIDQLVTDGLQMWISAHFEESQGKLVLAQESEDAINDFLEDVKAVTKELENDDFQRVPDDRDDNRQRRREDDERDE